MKTLKLILLIAVMPSIMFFTTNCESLSGKPDLTIDRFKKCLDSCEERRNSADVERQTCLDQAYDSYMRGLAICGNKSGGNACRDKALTDYRNKIDRCELQWKERLAKIAECRKLCYEEADIKH